jgi:chemotaxis protein MotA
MDLGTIFGIIAGLSLIIGAVVLGGNLDIFINVPGMMIVGGGTIAATLITFPLGDAARAFKAAWLVFMGARQDPNELVRTMLKLTNLSRQQGLLALSKIKTPNQFLHKAAMLIADGSDEEMIRNTLRIEIEALKHRHAIGQDVFRKMGTYAPAFGMLGTLIGLVQMLQKISDPASLGPAMAVALLTTFYGSFLASLFFLPIAGKLKARTSQEVLNLEIIFEGAISILDNNNPLVVYEKLSSFIAPSRRKRMSLRSIRAA